MQDEKLKMKNTIVFMLMIVLSCAMASAQDLKVCALRGLPPGGYAVYANAVHDLDGTDHSAVTTISWLKLEENGGVWLEFVRDEGKKTTVVKALAAPDGRVLRMATAQGKSAASWSDKMPEKASVLMGRSQLQDKGSETVTTAAGTFTCWHYSQSASEDATAKKSGLTLVTTVAKQHDVWISESGDFLGLVRERTVKTITEKTYLGDRLLPKKSPARQKTETVELQRVSRSGAASRIKE